MLPICLTRLGPAVGRAPEGKSPWILVAASESPLSSPSPIWASCPRPRHRERGDYHESLVVIDFEIQRDRAWQADRGAHHRAALSAVHPIMLRLVAEFGHVAPVVARLVHDHQLGAGPTNSLH